MSVAGPWNTFGYIPTDQSLALMRPFLLDSTLTGTVSANSSNNTLALGSFTMPFTGQLVYSGFLRLATAATGSAIAQVSVASGSTPAPTTAPADLMRVECPSGQAIWTQPFMAHWSSINSGTAVTLLGSISTSGSAVGVMLLQATGIAFATMS